MKRIVSALLVLAVLAALVIVTTTSKHAVRAVYAQSGCSNATVTGNYGVTFSGFNTKRNQMKGNEVPFAGVGVLTFDGAGNLSGTIAVSNNGAVGTNILYTATYTVNPDCSGSMTSTNGAANFINSFVIVSGGAEAFSLDSDAGNTWTVDWKKQ